MKALTMRTFGKKLAAVTQQLEPGESIGVTKRGKRHGDWTRAVSKRRHIPNIPKRLACHPYTDEEGAASIKAMLDDL